MPGLRRAGARTAVVVGTATAVGNRVSRRRAERWQQRGRDPYGQPQQSTYQQPPPQSEPEPRPEPQVDLAQQLRDLARNRALWTIVDAEFTDQQAERSWPRSSGRWRTSGPRASPVTSADYMPVIT